MKEENTNNQANNNQTPTQGVPVQAQVVTPVDREVINTKKKKNSNVSIFIIVVILGVILFYMDNILDYFDENITPYIKETEESLNGNLYNGKVKIDDSSSYMTTNSIKFYNFKRGSGTILLLNYVSSKSFSNVKNKDIYIEIYNSDSELLYKELFNLDSLEKNTTGVYSINVSNDIYSNAFYMLVHVYTKDEEKSNQTLNCTFDDGLENTSLNYSITYNFTNNNLISYAVNKEFTYISESTEVTKYKEDLKNEYLNLNNYNITAIYSDTSVNYTITLSTIPEGFNPLHNGSDTPYVIKTKEQSKGWTCK